MIAMGAHQPRVTVCFPFSGDSVGGSHISVMGLLRHLDTSRFKPVIAPEIADGQIARFFAGFDQVIDPSIGGRLFVPGEAFGPFKLVRTIGRIRPRISFLKRHGVDIVHVNDGRTSANWALAARLAGARLVWHHRGDPQAIGLRLAAPLLASSVLTVSNFALPDRGLWSAARKAEVVHSPFDTDIAVDRRVARATLDREFGLTPDTLVLGFFGSFVPRKRPLLFVDAVARLRAMLDRPVVGLMFGEARTPAMARALDDHIATTATDGTVILMGYRSPGPFWIAACDQLVVPAVGEPFGRTLIEAMLVGTPVVAARSGGNVEALHDGLGLLVPADDAQALAEACRSLADDPAAAAAIAARAQQNTRTRFSEAHHAVQVSAVYDRLA